MDWLEEFGTGPDPWSIRIRGLCQVQELPSQGLPQMSECQIRQSKTSGRKIKIKGNTKHSQDGHTILGEISMNAAEWRSLEQSTGWNY